MKLSSKLLLESSQLKEDSELYEVLAIKGRYSLTMEEYANKKNHQKSLLSQASHREYQSEESKCLSCEKVLSCIQKC